MTRFHIMKWRVAEAHLGTVMSVVTEANVAEYIGSELDGSAPPPPSTPASTPTPPSTPKQRYAPGALKPRTFRYKGGVHNKGLSGEKLVLQTLEHHNHPLQPGAFRKAFLNHNPPFAENSASPVLSRLVKQKILTYRDGFYGLPRMFKEPAE